MEPLEQLRSEIDSIDREMGELFVRRMDVAARIAAYKQEHALPVYDPSREGEVLSHCIDRLSRHELVPFYALFQEKVMDLSKEYQHHLLHLLKGRSTFSSGVLGYEVFIERGSLSAAGCRLALDRRVMIVTDNGVPPEYAEALARQCRCCAIHRVSAGEGSKSLDTVRVLLRHMTDFGLTRGDCVAAVGGGMVGDLAGFAASIYMRGVDFYNVPTTLLSQVDSSIGGKTAVDFSGVKNLVGTFHRPRAVLIDPVLLETLPRRQAAAGLAEVVKMAMTSDKNFFDQLESGDLFPVSDGVIRQAAAIKAAIVSSDEREQSLRRILNFGHTIGHAIELTHPELLHGECVALGMLPMCDGPTADRLRALLIRLGLPIRCRLDRERILRLMEHDKKTDKGSIIVTRVPEPGQFYFQRVSPASLVEKLGLIEEGGTEL